MEKKNRIVGGEYSTNGKYPWMVALWDATIPWEQKFKHCGGTLIASGWVVTAAHCIFYEKNGLLYKHTKYDLYVVLGEFDLRSANDRFDTNRKRVWLHIDPIVHEHYNNPIEMSNDIAMLKLDETVDLNIYTPACLPPPGEEYTGKKGRVYGWGSLQSCPPRDSYILMEAEISIISDADCRDQRNPSVWSDQNGICAYREGNYRYAISDEMLCAGAPGKDSCQGDSGGPFTVKERRTNKHELVGVVSWGVGCAADGMSGVYVEVAKLRGWIDWTIKNNGGAKFCDA